MTELFLKFNDENGNPKKIAVDEDKFTVGRGSENNLVIANNSLSRKQISIERFADVFIVSDCGSSNGTTLNDNALEEPVGLKKEDKLILGNSLEIEVEMISDSDQDDDNEPEAVESPAINQGSNNNPVNSSSSISPMFFIITPIVGLFLVLIVGVGFYAFSSKPEIAENRDIFIRSDKPSETTLIDSKNDDVKEDADKPTPKPVKTELPNSVDNNLANSTSETTPTVDNTEVTATPKVSVELDKVERNAYSFMRKIAENDTNPVLTNPQLQILSAKINQVKSTSSLRENLKSARLGKSNIENLARERNLKPQFLAVAALAKLGNERGDAANNASQMRDVLNELRESVGNALADDCLLMMAAYNEGANGEKSKMRDLLAQLTKSSQLSVRQIRTIWFLKDNGKISDAQFELAIRFFAIGTISQNPKDFGVSEEALNF